MWIYLLTYQLSYFTHRSSGVLHLLLHSPPTVSTLLRRRAASRLGLICIFILRQMNDRFMYSKNYCLFWVFFCQKKAFTVSRVSVKKVSFKAESNVQHQRPPPLLPSLATTSPSSSSPNEFVFRGSLRCYRLLLSHFLRTTKGHFSRCHLPHTLSEAPNHPIFAFFLPSSLSSFSSSEVLFFTMNEIYRFFHC